MKDKLPKWKDRTLPQKILTAAIILCAAALVVFAVLRMTLGTAFSDCVQLLMGAEMLLLSLQFSKINRTTSSMLLFVGLLLIGLWIASLVLA